MSANIDAGFQRLRETVFFFLNNWYAISVVVLSINIPLVALQLALDVFVVEENSPNLVKFSPEIAGFLVGPLSSAAVIIVIARIVAGQPWSLSSVLRDAVNVWPQLIVATMLMASIVMLGLFALILPGIYLFLRLLFVEFAVVLEARTPVAAIERSFTLTSGRLLEILQPLALMLSAYILVYWLISVLMMEAGIQNGAGAAVFTLFFTVFSALFTILLFRLYQIASGTEKAPAGS